MAIQEKFWVWPHIIVMNFDPDQTDGGWPNFHNFGQISQYWYTWNTWNTPGVRQFRNFCDVFITNYLNIMGCPRLKVLKSASWSSKSTTALSKAKLLYLLFHDHHHNAGQGPSEGAGGEVEHRVGMLLWGRMDWRGYSSPSSSSS